MSQPVSQPVSRSTPPPTLERLLFPVTAIVVLGLLNLTPNLLSPTVELIGLAIVVALFGMPHGALDPWIAEKMGLIRTRTEAVAFNLVYLLIAALVVVVWTVFRLAACWFLAISAWHFSGDWSHDMGRLTRLGVGLLLLLMPIGFHTDEVAMLFNHLSGDGANSCPHPFITRLAFGCGDADIGRISRLARSVVGRTRAAGVTGVGVCRATLGLFRALLLFTAQPTSPARAVSASRSRAQTTPDSHDCRLHGSDLDTSGCFSLVLEWPRHR